jgi:glycosyltransferase involved in cell wall biosynthesis
MSQVNVIIPCYNYAPCLPLCVGSVVTQTNVDLRVLIIDDASVDSSAEIACQLAAGDPRIEVRRHRRNRGHIATYNEGLQWAAGDYTVLLSADDLLAPGALARATTLLDAHPEVGFAYGRSLFFSREDGLPKARVGPVTWEIWPGQAWLALRCRAGHNCISSPEVVARRRLYQELGGYREDLPHAGDLELWMRFAAHSDVAYIAGADQAYYRVHPASMQRRWLVSLAAELRQRKLAYDLLFKTQAQAIPNAGRLHGLANRALAREALWRACRAYDRTRLTSEQIDELVEFAFSAYADAASLREWHGLRRRRRLGRRLNRLLEPVVVPGLALRRLRSWWWWRHWRQHGV